MALCAIPAGLAHGRASVRMPKFRFLQPRRRPIGQTPGLLLQAPTKQPPTDQAPGAKSDITRVQAGSDTSGVVSGQAKSDEPSMGAGSKQLPSPNSEDQGGTGIKGSAQSEGATNKDTAPRDTAPE